MRRQTTIKKELKKMESWVPQMISPDKEISGFIKGYLEALKWVLSGDRTF